MISAITEDDKSLIVFVDGVGLQRFVNGHLKPYLLKDGIHIPRWNMSLVFIFNQKVFYGLVLRTAL